MTKKCTCCGVEKAWTEYRYVGIQDMDGDPPLELRNCDCGSTVAREMSQNWKPYAAKK